MDSPTLDSYAGEVLMNTEMTRSVMSGIKTFEPVNWELTFEKGNLTEKL
jgi:hypothetical protein